MTRDREAFLFDIYDSAVFLLEFVRGQEFRRYHEDRPFRRVIERELEVIGEAMFQLAKLDSALAARISESQQIIGFRHVLVHGYFQLKADVVWNALQNKLGTLVLEAKALLTEAGFPPIERGLGK